VESLRASRRQRRDPIFVELVAAAASRLKTLKYDQTTNLLGPKAVINNPIPWGASSPAGGKGKRHSR
jgi:hypothetical protein